MLALVLRDYPCLDRHHIGMMGFSDGASFALSMGLLNGDLFSHCMALSPGRLTHVADHYRTGALCGVYVSHGIQDDVLDVRETRAIVEYLREHGCVVRCVLCPSLTACSNIDVVFAEFEGEHVVPSNILEEALSFFLDNVQWKDM